MRLSGQEKSRLPKRFTENTEAYQGDTSNSRVVNRAINRRRKEANAKIMLPFYALQETFGAYRFGQRRLANGVCAGLRSLDELMRIQDLFAEMFYKLRGASALADRELVSG